MIIFAIYCFICYLVAIIGFGWMFRWSGDPNNEDEYALLGGLLLFSPLLPILWFVLMVIAAGHELLALIGQGFIWLVKKRI